MKRSWIMLGTLALALALSLPVLGAEVENFTPVTNEMLLNAADNPDDWLMWRRTYNAWGYSPLDQINRYNVDDLQLAWAWAMEPGPQETTPLVHDGIMYLPHPGGVVQALDATSGDLIWEYRHNIPTPVAGSYYNEATRNVAMYEDKIFYAATGAHLVALDARTGQVVWDQVVGDFQQSFTYTGGPLVVEGKVIAGMSGCTNAAPGGCYITAHDVETGEELWRTYTLARPGDPANETWDGLPVDARYGGSAWITGSYDPDTGLVYWGVGQPIPWVRETRGTDGANLYTNSTLALDPDTGEIVWYYQFNPGDTWDEDEHYEQMLMDVGERKLLVTFGKKGIAWALDARTGEFIWATETVYQNMVTIDPRTGKTTENPDSIPTYGETTLMCPSTTGGKNWPAASYNPVTGGIYIGANNTCQEVQAMEFTAGIGQSTFDITGRRVHAPGSDGNVGRITVLSVEDGSVMWRHDQRAASTAATLSTAGGLAFWGDENRRFKAFDAWTGEVLWEVPLSAPVSGYPITYAVDDQQYLAVPVGIPQGFRELTPEIQPPNGGNAVLVFTLPD